MDGVPAWMVWLMLVVSVFSPAIPAVALGRAAYRRNSVWLTAAAFAAGALWLVYAILATWQALT